MNDIKHDKEGEWLEIRYDGFRMKEIQRFSEHIRPTSSTQETQTSREFQYGFRFFYWPYYKNRTETHDDARGLSMSGANAKHEANTGYTVGELYVEQKYKDLKEELLKNNNCTINATDWKLELGKARAYLWSDNCKEMKCARASSAQYYGLRNGWKITEDHLVAMVIYCDKDVCSFFSSSQIPFFCIMFPM